MLASRRVKAAPGPGSHTAQRTRPPHIAHPHAQGSGNGSRAVPLTVACKSAAIVGRFLDAESSRGEEMGNIKNGKVTEFNEVTVHWSVWTVVLHKKIAVIKMNH